MTFGRDALWDVQIDTRSRGGPGGRGGGAMPL